MSLFLMPLGVFINGRADYIDYICIYTQKDKYYVALPLLDFGVNTKKQLKD